MNTPNAVDDADVSWLALHPQEIADRAKGSALARPGLTLLESVALGSIGFMVVSVAGFAPWALAGRALHRAVGEVGLYVDCAVVFIGLSGAVRLPVSRILWIVPGLPSTRTRCG